MNRKTLIDAVEAGELTDPGAMTTTRDVADALPYAAEAVEAELRALEEDGAVTSATFGGAVVWTVTDDSADERTDPDPGEPLPTTTRA